MREKGGLIEQQKDQQRPITFSRICGLFVVK